MAHELSPGTDSFIKSLVDTIKPIERELSNRAQIKLKKFRQNPPNSLFHYTDAVGLQGIISSKSLWATDIRYLNDSKELSHASEIVLSTIEEKNKQRLSYSQSEFLNQLSERFDHTDSFHIFTISFSEEKDSLDQWRGYSGGTGGFAIGFNLTDLAFEQRLMKVCYNEDDQRQIVKDVIDEMAHYYEKSAYFTSKFVKELLITQFCVSFARLIFTLAPQFKSKHWASEKEWRIILTSMKKNYQDNLKFRAGKMGLIPYVEFKPKHFKRGLYEKMPINTVVQGPSPHAKLGRESLEQFLHSVGHHDVRIEASSVPLRF
ncbi:DUF2971 domain-containing protein [Azospirillum melinis]